jgi:hypothetical protein
VQRQAWKDNGYRQVCNWLLIQKTATDLTTDYADVTDTIGYDYQCPEVLRRKDSYAHPHDLFKICGIGGICGFNFGIWLNQTAFSLNVIQNHPCTISPIREFAGHDEAAVAAVPFRQTVSGEGVSTLMFETASLIG